MVEVTNTNFNSEVIESEYPVFVEFWASWCPPCKMMEPMIHALESEYDGSISFVSINIDRNPDIAEKYNVKGVPTFVIFNKGMILSERLVGAQTRKKLVHLLTINSQ